MPIINGPYRDPDENEPHEGRKVPKAHARLKRKRTYEKRLSAFRDVFGRDPATDEELEAFSEEYIRELYNSGYDEPWPHGKSSCPGGPQPSHVAHLRPNGTQAGTYEWLSALEPPQFTRPHDSRMMASTMSIADSTSLDSQVPDSRPRVPCPIPSR